MKYVMALTLVLLFCVSTVVMAQDTKIPNDGGPPGPRVDCDVTGCTPSTMTVGVTLVTDQLYTYGPVPAAAGGPITKVVLSLNLTQTWCGDLLARVYYDADGNGTYDFGPVEALCRPGLAGPCNVDGCCGCSGDLAGVYTFGDDAVESLGDPTCPTAIPAGCFLPAPESTLSFAAAFNGAPAGGNFYLEIADAAAGDDTHLNSWGVFVCTGTPPAPGACCDHATGNCTVVPQDACAFDWLGAGVPCDATTCVPPTPTESASWGQIKQIYR